MTGKTGPGQVAGFVLAGGASRRFGRDKALVDFGGQPLIARLGRILQAAVGANVGIVGDAEKYGHLGVECITDRWPGEGPLGGIITALRASETSANESSWSLIISCDMPFLTLDWLRHIIERALASKSDVVMAESHYGLEPLAACWRASAASALARAFESGTRRISDAMKHLPIEVLDAVDWKRFDNFDRLFWNMNTPADYDEAIRILNAEQP